MNKKSQSGNVLFLILIAVALFAALSFAVTQSTRSGDNQTADQNLDLQASQILQYASLMQNQILRLIVSGQCTEEQINFKNNIMSIRMVDGTHSDLTNSNAPVDGSCDVFSPAGANVNEWLLSDDMTYDGADCSNTNFTARNSFLPQAISIQGIGTEAPDLVLRLGRLDDDLCMKINDIQGVENPSNQPPVEVVEDERFLMWNALPTFRGVYPASTANPIGDEVTDLYGRTRFCIQTHSGSCSGADAYKSYFHVLIER